MTDQTTRQHMMRMFYALVNFTNPQPDQDAAEVMQEAKQAVELFLNDETQCITVDLPCDTQDERKADTHLIASAPDLLEALESFVDVDFRSWNKETQNKWEACRAAIAKAKGEQMKATVEMRRYEVEYDEFYGKYRVLDTRKCSASGIAYRIPTREAAERIAAIYEEVQP